MKTTFFNSYEDTAWPPQCHNFYSTAGAGGFTAGAAAPAVNMLEEALVRTKYLAFADWEDALNPARKNSSGCYANIEILKKDGFSQHNG